jgi:drug/metabolite transporter (DMT)-like permease
MRIAAPAIGPVATADVRMLIAGAALAAYYAFTGFDAQWRRWWRYYLFIGALNSAAPFLLYGYAALDLSVGLMAVLNATSPMWGALLSALVLRERLSPGRIAGLILGVIGVALVSGAEASTRWLAILAGLAAAFCYDLTGVVLLVPLLALAPPAWPSTRVALAMLALGLVCGALAYVLYSRLIADIGATGALTVTYLIPIFGVLWGTLFLGEALSAAMIAGALVVIAGTVLVLRG